ncbi:PorT family protein [Inquilinus sp. KBS0705]|nr:PorT family protein [Inquilinus sp. KBS0705]
MKEEKEDSIDKLFSGGLNNPTEEVSYREEDWDALEGMLDGTKPKGVTRKIIYLIGAIAAMLVLLLGYVFLSPPNKPQTKPDLVKTTPATQKDSGTVGSPSQQLADHTQSLSDSVSIASSAVDDIRKSKSFFTLSAAGGDRTYTGTKAVNQNTGTFVAPAKPDTITGEKNNNLTANKPDTITGVNNLALNNTVKKDTITGLAATTTPAKPLVTVTDDIKPKKQKVSSAAYGFRPTFSLGIIASPDINGVKTFANNKVGTNAGLILTLNLSRRWSISSGAVYADKPYNADFANYKTNYPFATTPTSVTASCIVLDIPLNVGYQFYNKNRNKFSLGTGLSSYFMLSEDYKFNHAEGGYNSIDPWTYNIKNQNKHIMGILNLNATYQREVNSKLDIGIQPYMKLPLTGIGYGQVNLRSAGVSVSVMYNFKTGIKPK